ncbi:MAG: carbamoyltransferase HypF, partial [Nitrospirae bacterium]|nr:carbamoyltransferase HypF [Nitrospirota bacterium]
MGFRPYVYTVATSLCLRGYVANTADGVDIEVEGENVGKFLPALVSKPPPQARIDETRSLTLPLHGYEGFRIVKSIDSPGIDGLNASPITFMPADISTCDDCLHELLNPADRRYLYPFINCVNCGPRYTIIKSLPYDRESTTMSVFRMCEECGQEYDNPQNRRFHAQPTACPKCGPAVELVYSDTCRRSNPASNPLSKKETDPIRKTVELLKDGAIIAIKGLGGFHIACDATNDAAVKRLRTQKRKSNKPFAVMVAGAGDAADLCFLSEDEKNLLESCSRPIVLLRKKGNHLSTSVSPENRYYGVMLPYTPLHYLLFYYPLHGIVPFGSPHFKALVMTSGNISGTPVISENSEALRLPGDSVDGFLLHNRDIYNRVDDSVLFVTDRGTPMFVRRGRGFVPMAIGLPCEGPQVVAVGADVKNTFALTKGKYLIPGPHIGDMGNYETLEFFEKSMSNMMNTFRINPEAIACDLHPGYFSTTLAEQMASIQTISAHTSSAQISSTQTLGMEIFAVQHHHAHIGSVMAEHRLTSKVIGVVLDGTGYGEDGNLWGGEFIVAGVSDFTRIGHFKYIALPGGEMAIREPIRVAISLIADAWGAGANEILEKLGFIEKYGKYFIETIMAIIPVKEVSPLSS